MKALDIIPLRVGQMETNCYIVSEQTSGSAIIIDPGDDGEYITDTVSRRHLDPVAIMATHGHFDHIMAGFAIQAAFGIPFLIHHADDFLVKRMRETAMHFLGVSPIDPPPNLDVKGVHDGDRVALGATHLAVIGAPGHTPGGIALYHEASGFIAVGDTLFADGAVGRTDHHYSSRADLDESIKRILSLPAATIIYPGHGESTTVALANVIFSV